MKNEIFDINGMSCSACSAAVSAAVNKLNGIKKADVNLLTNSMTVTYDENSITVEEIINAVIKAGYKANIKAKNPTEENQKKVSKNAKKVLLRLILSSVFLVLLMFVAMCHMIGIDMFHDRYILKGIIEIILLTPILFLNIKYFISGFRSIIKLSPNMDSLISIGAIASIIYSLWQMFRGGASHYYFESAGMILTFITIGKYLESLSKAKTTDAITKLMDLSPKTSLILVNGVETEIESKDIKVGDIVIVKGGMTFPADGEVISGSGSVNESAITGESLPVSKERGLKVIGGTVLLDGYIQFRAEHVGEETILSGIIKLVEDATVSKPKIARLADKISRVFVPAVILIAILTTTIWFVSTKDFEHALNFGISVLVISCPCALGLATPTAIMVGTGRAAELGILVKSAEIFEAGSKIKKVMLDKTGTITNGTPEVTDVITESNDEAKLMGICASIESMSDHPLAQAVVKYVGVATPISVDNFEAITGKGVRAVVNNTQYKIGNRAFAGENISKFLFEASEKLYAQGKTVLYVNENTNTVALIGIADTVKDSAKEAIELLDDAGIQTIMLTGDNKFTAENIRIQVGITESKAELLPAEKNEIIKQYQLESPTAMVGDGINDSPALAVADVGIALGAGTDIAMESADVVLIRNDLRDVHTTLYICRYVMRNIKQNLFWALIYNAICIPIAAGVLYSPLGIELSPMIGTIAMSLSSICVISNALRLKNIKRGYKVEAGKEIKAMKTVYIEGMACGHCSARVTELLKPLDANVVVDHVAGTAVISSDADNNEIKTIVENAGYKVINIA